MRRHRGKVLKVHTDIFRISQFLFLIILLTKNAFLHVDTLESQVKNLITERPVTYTLKQTQLTLRGIIHYGPALHAQNQRKRKPDHQRHPMGQTREVKDWRNAICFPIPVKTQQARPCIKRTLDQKMLLTMLEPIVAPAPKIAAKKAVSFSIYWMAGIIIW